MRGGRLSPAPAALAPPAAFDRWLTGPPHTPVALALSGGGDSLALLHLARTWAERARRPLVALTVDHGLNPESAAWSRFAADRAERLGVPHRVLAWTGEKPASGLPAAARTARHALLADAARDAGARVVLMGHTADDLLEAEAMRAAGAATPSPRTWSPSPAWPEGRGVFLLRPLLTLRRAALREMLRGLGEVWIDDPANDDPRFARSLARRHLACAPAVATPPMEAREPWPGLDLVRHGRGGDLIAPRAALVGAGAAIGALALCASGGTRPPAGAAIERISQRLAAGAAFITTLAGARIEAGDEDVRFCREAGEWRRRGLTARPLPLGESVFDGRFRLVSAEGGAKVTRLGGLAARLPADERRRLLALPAAVRGALPAVIAAAGSVSSPVLAPGGTVRAWALNLTRLRATLGAVSDEASLWRVAESEVGA